MCVCVFQDVNGGISVAAISDSCSEGSKHLLITWILTVFCEYQSSELDIKEELFSLENNTARHDFMFETGDGWKLL